MPIDSNIYSQIGQGVKSVADYDQQYAQLDAAKQAREMGALNLLMGQRTMQAQDRATADQQALRSLVSGFGTDDAANEQALIRAGRLPEAQAYRKAAIDAAKDREEIGFKRSQTRENDDKIVGATLQRYRDALSTVRNPDDYVRHLKAQYDDPVIGPIVQRMGGDFMTAASRIPTDPAAFQEYVKRSAMGMDKFIADQTTRANARLSADTQRENARIADERAREIAKGQLGLGYSRLAEDRRQHNAGQAAASQAVTYVTDPETGNLVAVPTKLAPGASPVGRAAVGADGKPIMGKGGAAGGKVADAKEAIALLDQAEPLLKSSTGSLTGKAIDNIAGVFGAATEGAISAQRLKALEGALVAKMPKMSGPQSDKDVMLYRQMAAQIGDDTIPYARKVAALDTVREIQERYAGMAPGSSKPPAATKIGSDAEYNALPSGATFVGPDGKTRRKP